VVPFTLSCICLILQLAVLLLVTDKSFDRTKTIKYNNIVDGKGVGKLNLEHSIYLGIDFVAIKEIILLYVVLPTFLVIPCMFVLKCIFLLLCYVYPI
jgi:hypothetical protein